MYTKTVSYNVSNPVKIKFTLYDTGERKLNLIKSIKEITKWGLKESKDFMDNAPSSFTMYTDMDELKNFKERLIECDCKYNLDDVTFFRNKKLIELGIYDKSDLVNELVERDMQYFNPTDEQRNILMTRYKLISEDDIKKILEE